MLVARRALSHPAAPGRAMATISMAGRAAWCWRKDSLTRRLIRLRCTADLETFFETASPSRADGPSLRDTMMVKQSSPRRRPVLNTRLNSAGDNRRFARVKDCERAAVAGSFLTAVPAGPGLRRRVWRGPWRVGATAPGGRSWLPCGRGNHGCACGAGCSVDRCVSWCCFRPRYAGDRPDRGACQKDGRSYARACVVSTRPRCAARRGRPVDNSGRAS